MKRQILCGMGLAPAALLMAGAAVAGAPSGHSFNQWSATAGTITLNSCSPPACVVLLSENGMLQARVRADNDPDGQGYFQTITAEEGFTGTAATAVFRNESFIAATNQATNFDMAALQFVDLDSTGIMQIQLASGSLRDVANNEAAFDLYQTVDLTGFANVRFHYEKQGLGGQFSTNTSSGDRLRLDYRTDGTPALGTGGVVFTSRQTSGFYTQGAGSLELADGASITYAAGHHIGTTFLTGLLWHGGSMHMPNNQDRILESQFIRNYTTGEGFNWKNANDDLMDDTGVGYVNFVAVWGDAFGANPNLWNANFGDAPGFVPSGTATLTPLAPDVVFPGFDHGLIP